MDSDNLTNTQQRSISQIIADLNSSSNDEEDKMQDETCLSTGISDVSHLQSVPMINPGFVNVPQRYQFSQYLGTFTDRLQKIGQSPALPKLVELPPEPCSSQSIISLQPSKRKPRRENLLHWLESHDKGDTGPLKFLRQCMLKKQRILVSIRGVNYVRSYIRGFLIAFDKHWNLALQDVDEFFIKPSSTKEISTSLSRNQRRQRNRQERQHLQSIPQEAVNVSFSRTKSSQTPSRPSYNDLLQVEMRHVSQLLVRGDNVVIVRLAEPSKTSL